jgi:putative DNA primase/helicase
MSSQFLESALSLAAQGFAVHPLHENSKKPHLAEWQKQASSDHAQIHRWWGKWPTANIGLATGQPSGLCVIDVDSEEGAALLPTLGPLPETIRVKTARGCHYWLRLPATGEFSGRASGFLGPGLDVKCAGGFVVAPPSFVVSESCPEGHTYRFVNKGQIATCPDWLPDRLAQEAFTPPVPQPIPVETPKRLMAALRALAKAKPARQGDSGHATLLRACRIGYRFGVESEIWEPIVWDQYCPICEPPYTDRRELAHKMRDGYKPHPTAPQFGHALIPTEQPKPKLEVLPGGNRKPEGRIYTESGLAEELVDQYGKDLRYCGSWRKWLTWNGKLWRIDDESRVLNRTLQIARKLRWRAASSGSQELFKKAIDAEAGSSRTSVARLATADERVQLDYTTLNAKPMLFNVANGTIELDTGVFRPHSRDDFLTKSTRVTYDPAAQCPRWLAFLDRIFQGNQELIGAIQRAAGYSMTASVEEHALFLLYGEGANGKGTFVNTLKNVIGTYAVPGPPGLLMARKFEEHATEFASLFGTRMVVYAETQAGQSFNEEKLKALTGGDPISGRRMREDFWEFEPSHKFWISTNHKPSVKGDDEGIWRRLKLIPFAVTIPEAERDTLLGAKLQPELPGILNWCLAGCAAWRANGLAMPKEVTEATAAYRADNDRLGDFLAACCVVKEGCQVTCAELYSGYKKWAENEGEKYVWTAKQLGGRVKDRLGIASETDCRLRCKIYRNIGMLQDRPEEKKPENTGALFVSPMGRAHEHQPLHRYSPVSFVEESTREPGEDEEPDRYGK